MAEYNIYGFGYEGKTAEELIATLKNYEISTLIDVRLTPISRKKGLSKTKLRAAIEAAGMKYHHLPALGNPKDNRAGFSTPYTTEWAVARHNFEQVLENENAVQALEEIHQLLEHGNVGLLCFEADTKCCHRDVIMTKIGSTATPLLQLA